MTPIEEYYHLTNKIFEGNFKERIQRQLEQRNFSLSFRDRATDIFEEIINELSVEVSKRTFVVGQPPHRSLQFEDMQFKLCMTTSKKITIDGVDSYYFDSDEQKALKREFEAYVGTEHIITKLRREG